MGERKRREEWMKKRRQEKNYRKKEGRRKGRLCGNKTVFTEAGGGLQVARGPQLSDHWSRH